MIIDLFMAACTILLLFAAVRWVCDEHLSIGDAVDFLLNRSTLEDVLRARRHRRDIQRLKGGK